MKTFLHSLRLKITFTILLFFPFFLSAQNLVPNGSFEEYEQCPEVLDLTGTVTNWYNALNSCDYYNACANPSNLGVPDNAQSYQQAFEGFGYCSFATYVLNIPEYREVLGVKLEESLQIGTTYYFSFRLNKADKGENIKATNNVGLKFSMDSIQTEAELINNTAHFKIDSICYDSENWNLIKGSFVADAEYEYLFMGNFFNDANTQTDGPGTIWDRNGYYNAEDIRLSTDQAYGWPVRINELEQSLNEIIYDSKNQRLLISNKYFMDELIIYNVQGQIVKFLLITNDASFIDVCEMNVGIYVVESRYKKIRLNTLRFIKTTIQ